MLEEIAQRDAWLGVPPLCARLYDELVAERARWTTLRPSCGCCGRYRRYSYVGRYPAGRVHLHPQPERPQQVLATEKHRNLLPKWQPFGTCFLNKLALGA